MVLSAAGLADAFQHFSADRSTLRHLDGILTRHIEKARHIQITVSDDVLAYCLSVTLSRHLHTVRARVKALDDRPSNIKNYIYAQKIQCSFFVAKRQFYSAFNTHREGSGTQRLRHVILSWNETPKQIVSSFLRVFNMSKNNAARTCEIKHCRRCLREMKQYFI